MHEMQILEFRFLFCIIYDNSNSSWLWSNLDSKDSSYLDLTPL